LREGGSVGMEVFEEREGVREKKGEKGVMKVDEEK
jgi:hypothetical protein